MMPQVDQQQFRDDWIRTIPCRPPIEDLLAYEFPRLKQYMLETEAVESSEKFDQLFTEVKRYHYLCAVSGENVPMICTEIDEVWHQFILFSPEYRAYCNRFFGKYIDHLPTMPSEKVADGSGPRLFYKLHRRYLGEPSEYWVKNKMLLC